VVFFQPLAQAYRKELEEHTHLGVDYSVDKTDFITFYQKAKQSVGRPEVINSCWKKAGLFPINPELVLAKLPTKPLNERPLTPPEQIAMLIAQQKPGVIETPANSGDIQNMINNLRGDYVQGLVAISKLAKAATLAYTEAFIARKTNEDIIVAQQRKKQRADRSHEHYGEGLVMTLEMAQARDIVIAIKEQEKLDKQARIALDVILKAADLPNLFNEQLPYNPGKQSPKKAKAMAPASIEAISMLDLNAIHLEPPLQEPVHVHKTQRRGRGRGRGITARATEGVLETSERSTTTRSGRTSKPKKRGVAY
jgi:hypothetical protein